MLLKVPPHMNTVSYFGIIPKLDYRVVNSHCVGNPDADGLPFQAIQGLSSSPD